MSTDESMDGELGPRVSAHPITKQSLVLPLAPAILAVIILIPWVADSERRIHVLFIGLGLLGLAAWFTIGALRDDERWSVHRDGLAWRRGSAVKRWTWDRVHVSLQPAGQNTYVRLWLDGRARTLKPAYFQDVEELARGVEQRVVDTQLAAFLERIAARVDVRLGQTSFDADGIARGGKRLAWADAELGNRTSGGFTIHRKGAGVLRQVFSGFAVSGGIDPTPALQYAICETMIERAASAPAA